MIISELNYLEVVNSEEQILGGDDDDKKWYYPKKKYGYDIDLDLTIVRKTINQSQFVSQFVVGPTARMS